MELLLSLKEEVPESLWNQFKSSVQVNLKILFTKKCDFILKRVRTLLNIHFNPTLIGAIFPLCAVCCLSAAGERNHPAVTAVRCEPA